MSGKTAFESKEVKDLVSYIRFSLNPKDDASLLRIINRPTRGIGSTTIDLLVEYAERYKVSLFRALQQVDSIPSIKPAAKGKIKSFLSFYEQLRSKKHLDPVHYVNHIIEHSGYLAFLQKEEDETFQKRYGNIRLFVNSISESYQNNPSDSIEDFFQDLSLITDFDKEDFDAVRVMTIHAAKGLEWPVVFLPCMNSGLFPSPLAYSERDIEEERRLAYVAFTRPEKELYVSYSRNIPLSYSSHFKRSFASPFLKSIPNEYITKKILDKKTFM
jgi:DNA helicase-2/ATP-dependent DNA helicase PcrA